jgi:hypothetical protein
MPSAITELRQSTNGAECIEHERLYVRQFRFHGSLISNGLLRKYRVQFRRNHRSTCSYGGQKISPIKHDF